MEQISRILVVLILSAVWIIFVETHRGDDLHGLQHIAEMISVVCNIPRRLSMRCVAHRGDGLHGVLQHTVEIIFVVCITPLRWSLCTPQRRSQRCATHCRDDRRDVQHTAEINCTLQNKNRNFQWSMVAFKETISRSTSIMKEKNLNCKEKFFLAHLETTWGSNISTKLELNSKIL